MGTGNQQTFFFDEKKNCTEKIVFSITPHPTAHLEGTMQQPRRRYPLMVWHHFHGFIYCVPCDRSFKCNLILYYIINTNNIMFKFNESLIKESYKTCAVCNKQYQTLICRNCCENASNLYFGYELVSLVNRYKVPSMLRTKILLILTQIRTLLPLLHLEHYTYLLFKILNFMDINTMFYFGQHFTAIWYQVLPIVLMIL